MVSALSGWCPGSSTTPPLGRQLYESYGTRQGLGNLAVTCLCQDSQGLLWVGTQGNLYRFDGGSFQSFGLREGLPSGYIDCVASTGSELWVGTWSGLARRTGNGFTPVALPGRVPFPRIRDLEQDAAGALWVATTAGPFCIRAGQPALPLEGWPGGEARALAWTPGGIWFASGSRLLHRSPDGHWNNPEQPPLESGEQLEDVLARRDGTLLVRSPARIWIREPGQQHFVLLWASRTLSSQSGSRPYLEPDGTIWIPTDEGLLVLKQGAEPQPAPDRGLPTRSPRAVLRDREGTLWVAGQGLHRDLGQGGWEACTTREGLPHDQVWSILRDRRGTLWAGTSLGLARSSARGWTPLSGTTREAIRALAEDGEGRIWAGTAHGDLLILDGQGRLLERLPGGPILGSRKILALHCRPDGLWVGTDGAGLLRADRAGGRWRLNRVPGAPEGRVSQVLEDAQGRLWAATEQGLAILDAQGWHRFGRDSGLRQDHVSSLCFTRSGRVATGYFEPLGLSLLKLDAKGMPREVLNWDSSGPLSSDTVNLLGEDAEGRLWVGGARGVDILKGRSRWHIDTRNGLVGEDCDAGAFLAEADGTVWVGTSTGLVHYLGHPLEHPLPPPSVLLLEATLGRVNLPLSGQGPATVGYAERSLLLRFTGDSLLDPDQLEYAYRFKGPGDPPWRSAPSRELHLATLLPGDYILQLRAKRREGEWGPIRELGFSITPAWWQRTWLRLLGGLMLAALLARGVHVYVRYLRRRNQELEALLQLADTLARDLESANLNLQEQTLTDPLTGLKNRRFLEASIGRDLAEVERMQREEGLGDANLGLLFVMVDIDLFKHVNDIHGHLAGDSTLQQFADVLRAATRGSDTLIRYGGEEFLVLARQVRSEDATILVERIRRAVETRRFQLPSGEALHCTCSLGFAPFPITPVEPGGIPWSQSLAMADHCLYQAKEEGRNGWVGVLPGPPGLAGILPQSLSLEALLDAGSLRAVSSKSSRAPVGAQVDR